MGSVKSDSEELTPFSNEKLTFNIKLKTADVTECYIEK